MICNAHLDPVWLWEMPEGMAEALSTFRTAAELCEEDTNFIFNHNESVLYEWVLQFEPELFRRIQRLVRAKRWNIMGGWFLQPDCNMPSGESLVRQIQMGRQFFKQHFGVEVTTAINFDPFGHSRGLVQIMKQCGYDSYLFGRPTPDFLDLPSEDFRWVGFDGSEIATRRIYGWYNTRYGLARVDIEERIRTMPAGDEPVAILWGVGNHGGGPSRKDLRDVNRLIRETDEINIMHSTPQRYFKEMRKYGSGLKKYRKDINPWGTGCYTSMALVKQRHRQLENECFLTEKMVSAAAMQGLMKYPEAELEEAQRDLAFGQFHDSLPGSSIEPTEASLLNTMGHGLEILSRLKTEAFFRLARGQVKARQDQMPVLVYNPHACAVKAVVETEFNMAEQLVDGRFGDYTVYKGRELQPAQVEQEWSGLGQDWRKRVVFRAELAPGMNRFDCVREIKSKKPAIKLRKRKDKIVFRNKDLLVAINTRTGLVDRWQVGRKTCSAAKTFEPLVMADSAGSWGAAQTAYSKIVGRFRLMERGEGTAFSGVTKAPLDSVRIIEDGPVRTVVESVLSYNNSFVVLRYKLPKQGTEIELEVRVYWNEKDKMLKLSIPVAFGDGEYRGQTAYGVEKLHNNGNEVVGQKWTAAVSKEKKLAVTCINNCIYGSDYSARGMRLTLLRGCGYSTDFMPAVLPVQDRFTPRLDQGERKFTFWLNAGSVSERMRKIDREALVHNEEPFALTFFPKGGGGAKARPAVTVSDEVVQVSAVRKAMKGGDYVIRLFEPTGRARVTKVSIPAMGKTITVRLSGFEIKTLKVNLRSGRIKFVDLMEKEIE